jgi:hypothetical protein
MGIPVETVPFGDPKFENFSPWGWRRKFSQKRFGDGDGISSSSSAETSSPKTIKITLIHLYLSIL